MKKSNNIDYKVQSKYKDSNKVLIRSCRDIDSANKLSKLFASAPELKDTTISWDGAERIVFECGMVPESIYEEYLDLLDTIGYIG